MKARRAKRWGRTERERDLNELLESCRESDRRVSDALIVILTRGDAQVLAALGTVVKFAVRRAQRAR